MWIELLNQISDHFRVIFLIPSVKLLNKDRVSYIYKRFITDENIAAFNSSLQQGNWKETLECENINGDYFTFLYKFPETYGNSFQLRKYNWNWKITPGIKRSSKRKQLYHKVLKNRIPKKKVSIKKMITLFLNFKYKTKIKKTSKCCKQEQYYRH